VDSLPAIAFSALSLWALLYLPGHALVRHGAASLPTSFARVVASIVVTTLVATGLTAAEVFSLRALLAGNAGAALGCLMLRRWLGGGAPAPRVARDFVGPAVVAAALAAFWPAYPAFLAGSDSTAYVGSGISLARHGTLAREDELGPTISKEIRADIFDSMSQVLFSPGPPYRRVPGAMLIESLDDRRAWPCFFPVPSVWAAIAALRGGSLDERGAPDFAPFFAALALWAFWLVARQWLGKAWGLAATALLGASGPWYIAAHMPMSEPIAAFFVLAGLAFAIAAASGRRRADAFLAGAALGAAIFTRVEIAVVLALAFALMPVIARRRGDAGPALPAVFFTTLVAIASLTIVQAAMLPGTYVSPLLDHWQIARLKFGLRFGGDPSLAVLAGVAAAALIALAALVRSAGWSATIRWGVIFVVVVGQAAASRFLYDRTPMWLSFYLGWSGLALVATGAVLAWRARASLPAGNLLLALTAAVAAILFYNPHVYPALPWGGRRFVPMLLPMFVLLATFVASRAAAKNRLLGLAVLALIAWPIVEGSRVAWGERSLDGAWEQLQQVSAAIPKDGVILVDRQLSPFMIAPSLWLILDRNNVTMPPLDSKIGSELMTALAWQSAGKRTLYFVTRGAADHRRPPFVQMERVGEAVVRLRFLESAYSRPPNRMRSDILPIAVYKVAMSLDPKPGIVRSRDAVSGKARSK
jgi:hypothetical protein